MERKHFQVSKISFYVKIIYSYYLLLNIQALFIFASYFLLFIMLKCLDTYNVYN